MSAKIFDTNLCNFVRNLDDEELQWLLEAPTLVPELMGLTDHLPACSECGDRVGRILGEDIQRSYASATRRAPLKLAASNVEPLDPGDSLVAFDHLMIAGNHFVVLEDSEGRVWLRGPLPKGAEYVVLGPNRYRLTKSSRTEPEISGIGSIEIEQFIRQHEADPKNFPVHFAG
jgi:hypothetical protein